MNADEKHLRIQIAEAEVAKARRVLDDAADRLARLNESPGVFSVETVAAAGAAAYIALQDHAIAVAGLELAKLGVKDRPMHSLTVPFLCLGLTVGEINELRDLPPRPEALRLWVAAGQFCAELERQRGNIGGYYADRLGVVLYDARLLHSWWGHVADARCSGMFLADRIGHARDARVIHDWSYHGWAPVFPWWHLPTEAP